MLRLRGAIVVLLWGSLLLPFAARAETAEDQLAAAEALYRKSGASEALPEFERLAKTFKQRGDQRSYSRAVSFIGECQWRLGDYRRASEYLEQALALKSRLGDRVEEAKTLNVMGLVAWTVGDYPQATAKFQRAGEIGREMGDRKLEGAALNNLSLVGDEQGDYRTSLAQYQQVLALYREIDFARGEGDVLGNIGGVYLLLGQFREAANYYTQALAISDRLESKIAQSQDHGNLAMSLIGQGEIDAALAHLDQAAKLAVAAGMRRDEAYWQRIMANAQIEQGHYDQALDDYRAAVATYKDIGAQPELVEADHDIGRLYLLLGDSASAERHFNDAMQLARSIGSARAVTLNLLALGDLQLRREQQVEATALYEQALGRAREASEMAAVSECLLRLALVHREQNDLKQAALDAQQALDIARGTGARAFEAQALFALGEFERLSGDAAAALSRYDAAQTLAAASGDPELMWQILYGRARTLADRGDRASAVVELQKAIVVIEGVRERLRESRFRAGYVQDKYQVYIDLVRLQLQLGHADAAFSAAEQLRARGFVALLDGGRPIAGSEQERLRETELRERIRHLQNALDEEESRTHPERRERAITNFGDDLRAAEQEYEALLDDRGHLPGTSEHPVTYESLRPQLDTKDALVEYVVDRDALIIFVITRHALHARTIALRKTDLVSQVELLRDLIRHPEDERWAKPAVSLAETLIAPLSGMGVTRDVRQLYVVAHGVLNYLPFAVLSDGAQPLMEHLAIAYLPSAAMIVDAKRRDSSVDSMLVVAPSRSRLKHAPEEASAVDALFRPNSLLLAGGDATETRFRAMAGRYRNLHLATHGYFNKQNPLLSGIELEPDADQDGLLAVHEIMGLKLDADLVALSACQTGLGAGFFSDVPAGDDFVGLTRAFIYAGSAAVLATLWEVDDRSTSVLMKAFYQRLGANGGQTKPAALAYAQQKIRSNPKYRHPYYWAAFVLVGASGAHSISREQQLGVGS